MDNMFSRELQPQATCPSPSAHSLWSKACNYLSKSVTSSGTMPIAMSNSLQPSPSQGHRSPIPFMRLDSTGETESNHFNNRNTAAGNMNQQGPFDYQKTNNYIFNGFRQHETFVPRSPLNPFHQSYVNNMKSMEYVPWNHGQGWGGNYFAHPAHCHSLLHQGYTCTSDGNTMLPLHQCSPNLTNNYNAQHWQHTHRTPERLCTDSKAGIKGNRIVKQGKRYSGQEPHNHQKHRTDHNKILSSAMYCNTNEDTAMTSSMLTVSAGVAGLNITSDTPSVTSCGSRPISSVINGQNSDSIPSAANVDSVWDSAPLGPTNETVSNGKDSRHSGIPENESAVAGDISCAIRFDLPGGIQREANKSNCQNKSNDESGKCMNQSTSQDPSPSQTMNVQVRFTATSCSTPVSQKKRKSRPSCKKRRRQQQKRDSCPPETPTTPLNPDHLKRQKIDHSEKPTSKSKSKSSPSINIKSHSSFKVTLLDISPKSSPETLSASPLWVSPDESSPKPSKFAFVITSSDKDTESDWDSDSEDEANGKSDDLWESLSCQGLANPFSFSFTCSFSPSVDESPSTVKEDPQQTDTSLSGQNEVELANQRWNCHYANVLPGDQARPMKVHFPTTTGLAKVHRMVTWSFAYQAARKGPWEQYARDQGRFQKRIADVESAIKSIFEANHRQKILLKLQSM